MLLFVVNLANAIFEMTCSPDWSIRIPYLNWNDPFLKTLIDLFPKARKSDKYHPYMICAKLMTLFYQKNMSKKKNSCKEKKSRTLFFAFTHYGLPKKKLSTQETPFTLLSLKKQFEQFISWIWLTREFWLQNRPSNDVVTTLFFFIFFFPFPSIFN